jgi:hypothetical protein
MIMNVMNKNKIAIVAKDIILGNSSEFGKKDLRS